MKIFLIQMLILMTFFSCKEKGESLSEKENPEDSIRHTVCYNFPQDFDSLRCKNEICDTGMCLIYENIWKEILLEMNDLDNEYFDNHITLCKTQIDEWLDGYSFSVSYILTHGWAKTYRLNSFIIKIHADNTNYPDINLRRGVYLNKQEIITAIHFDAFNCNMGKISNLKTLKYSSLLNALSQLIDSAKVDTLCYRAISVDRNTGNLILEASGEYVNEYNSCIFGCIDLFTGETKIQNEPCFYED